MNPSADQLEFRQKYPQSTLLRFVDDLLPVTVCPHCSGQHDLTVCPHCSVPMPLTAITVCITVF